ncbi:MAG: peptide chain release factor N(5)-glutamine methyltransferase [Caldisericota bacterium]|nr:peptide chain release factor N(5)-glutamine methyltransferase [Caldisericota bacterium]
MDVKSLVLFGQKSLNNITDTPRLESELLLSYVLKMGREKILSNLAKDVLLADEENFKLLVKKRQSGYPFSYITNHKAFMGLDFFVREGILIPRPETEMLVEEAIKISNGEAKYVLDIGTGTGCIILSFLYYNYKSSGLGIDVSDVAIETAKKNALQFDLYDRVDFVRKDYNELTFDEEFDIVISNPPYVKKKNCKNLYFEPTNALDGGNDGFNFYPSLIEKSYKFLKKEGVLIIEIDDGIEHAIRNEMEKTGYKDIKILKDLAGFYRIAGGVK